jgi:hypothetical protein
METSAVQGNTQIMVSALCLSRNALHVRVGRVIMRLVAVVSGKPLRSFLPWGILRIVALAGEMLDLRDDLVYREDESD